MTDPTRYYNDLTYGSKPFATAKLKIKRVQRHLHELENAARELPKRRGYSFVVAPKPDLGKIEIIFMSSNVMPMELGGIVGDAVHNIRSAFDYVVFTITCPPYGKGNPEDKNISFPTGDTRQKFIEARDGRMKGAGPTHSGLSRRWNPTTKGGTISARFTTLTLLTNTN